MAGGDSNQDVRVRCTGDDELERLLSKVITGRVSLSVRKRLSSGEAIPFTKGDRNGVITVEGTRAFLRIETHVAAEKQFVPWGREDDAYEAMLEEFASSVSFGSDFENVSTSFHSRFEEDECPELPQKNPHGRA